MRQEDDKRKAQSEDDLRPIFPDIPIYKIERYERLNTTDYQRWIRDRSLTYADNVPYSNYWAALDAFEMGAEAGILWVLNRMRERPGVTAEQLKREMEEE